MLNITTLRKKDRLKYKHMSGTPIYKLKVVRPYEVWGDLVVVKCKVITPGWYTHIYITWQDTKSGRLF